MSAYDDICLVLFGGIKKVFQIIRGYFVIGVYKGKITACYVLQTEVAGGAYACIGLAVYTDACVPSSPVVQYAGAGISRAVVHTDDFQCLHPAADQTFQTPVYRVRCIVERDDDAHVGLRLGNHGEI